MRRHRPCSVEKAVVSLLALSLVLTLSLAGCGRFSLGSKASTDPAKVQWAVEARAREAIVAIKNSDLRKLALLVHPKQGVRFSPYSFVRTGPDGDRVFTAKELETAMALSRSFHWGTFDGSGKPIDLGFGPFWARFVYDRDFAGAPEVGYNKVIGRGNTLVNIAEAYPGSVFVEYHFPGSQKYGGMDWKSLRLVFTLHEGKWYLVGIIHDEWTI